MHRLILPLALVATFVLASSAEAQLFKRSNCNSCAPAVSSCQPRVRTVRMRPMRTSCAPVRTCAPVRACAPVRTCAAPVQSCGCATAAPMYSAPVMAAPMYSAPMQSNCGCGTVSAAPVYSAPYVSTPTTYSAPVVAQNYSAPTYAAAPVSNCGCSAPVSNCGCSAPVSNCGCSAPVANCGCSAPAPVAVASCNTGCPTTACAPRPQRVRLISRLGSRRCCR